MPNRMQAAVLQYADRNHPVLRLHTAAMDMRPPIIHRHRADALPDTARHQSTPFSPMRPCSRVQPSIGSCNRMGNQSSAMPEDDTDRMPPRRDRPVSSLPGNGRTRRAPGKYGLAWHDPAT